MANLIEAIKENPDEREKLVKAEMDDIIARLNEYVDPQEAKSLYNRMLQVREALFPAEHEEKAA